MSRNLNDLAIRMQELKKELPVKVATLTNKVALYLVKELTLVTPVDTSKALSNWQLSKTGKPSKELQAYVSGSRGSSFGASSAATQLEATQNIKGRKLGQTVFISNLADYIVKLNSGSSRQAPAGFVESAVLKARNNIKRYKLEL